jgi:hypothetical protein
VTGSLAALRIGSLCVRVEAADGLYLDDLSAIYCTPLHRPDALPPAGLHVEIVEAPGAQRLDVPPDGLVLTPDGELHSEAMFAQTALGPGESRARLTVLATGLTDEERRIYLTVLINKVLFRMGYVRLHASAVSLDGKVSVFVGDRGAGKSSICAYLAGRGGVVLADDDVVMHYDGELCAVGGCDETMRLMGDAEKNLFGRLDVAATDFGGIAKKEIRTAEHFATDPYVDHRLDRIFFPHVGNGFGVKHMPSSRLVMRLMKTLVPANRFAGKQDHAQTLGYLTDVAGRVAAYDLSLSRDFNGLKQLFEFLTASADERA